MDSYTRSTNLEKHEVRPGSLQDKLNGGEIIPTKKEEEWITEKKIKNNKTRQVETRVQRQLLMEDGKVIADSGPHIRTRTKEMNEKNDSEDENSQPIKIKKEVYEDKELFEKLKNSDEYIQLPHQDQLLSERIHRSNTVRECKQENYRFHNENLKDLDALDIHRTAVMSPKELLKANTIGTDSFSDEEIDGKAVKNGKFALSKRNRGKLTHYSAKGYKIVDNDEEREVAEYDENGKLIKKRYRVHNHELIKDNELPESMYDHEKYLNDLKEVAGNNYVKIPPVDYAKPPIRPVRLKNKSSSLINLNKVNEKQNISKSELNKEKLHHSRSRHHLKEKENRSSTPGKVLTYRDRNVSRQSSIVNGHFEEQVNITETETYSNHTDDWLENHFGLDKTKNNLRNRSASCDRNMESRNYYQKNYSRITKEDACVQASFSSDSEDERDFISSKPVKTFYFGEKEKTQTMPLKSSLKKTNNYYQRNQSYDSKLTDNFNSKMNKEYIHPIRVERDDNNNYAYDTKITRTYQSKKEIYEPSLNKVDAKTYDSNFHSPYIHGVPAPRERIIPLRTSVSFAEKSPVYSNYRSTKFDSTTNNSSNIRTDWPEFSPLSSPSEIVSTLRREKSTVSRY